MPYPRPLEALGEEIHYDTGDYIGLLDKLFAKIGWNKLNAEVKKRKAAGELVGIGVAMFVEKSGLGPTDGVKISIDTSGMVEVVTGGASIGQGFETVMAQVAADALGVDYKHCRVIHGQTDRIAFGIGAHASRATVMTASATHIAALNVRKKALETAGELLQTTPDALDIVGGEVVRKERGRPAPRSASARSRRILRPHKDARRPRSGPVRRRLVQDRAPGLSLRQPCRGGARRSRHRRRHGRALLHRLRHRPRHQSGAGARPDRRRLCARAGGALFEEFTYSEHGDPLAVTFADYLLPAMHETPAPEVLLREDYTTPLNPLGIKGAGESGITGVGAAIASAIDDAIGIPGAVRELPVTPQRVKAMLAKRGTAIAPRRSIELDAGELDHLGPFGGFVGDERAELAGRQGRGHEPRLISRSLICGSAMPAASAALMFHDRAGVPSGAPRPSQPSTA